MNLEQQAALRAIPSIEKLLTDDAFVELQQQYSLDLITDTLRTVVEKIRERIRGNTLQTPSTNASDYAQQVRHVLKSLTTSQFLPVINATGTITHTNLGRSLLSESACAHLVQAASNYVSLEYDLKTGKRGHRDRITEPLLQQLTGCEASTVVNNNAAAVLLALNTVAEGKEVVVSRGELIEIGGAFRIPDVMTSSGAILREVGTTNRTRLRDYENAIGENTGLLLKVHPSNYKVIGFASTPEIADITELGRHHGIPTMEDLGSGSLINLTDYGLPHEPVVRERVEAGVELVTFSGDKLLGGPQAGLIVGKAALIQKIRENPLMRALRVGKLTIAALEATLRLQFNEMDMIRGINLTQELPMLQRYTRTMEELRSIAEQLVANLEEIFDDRITVTIENCTAQIGSGSLPVETLPSLAVVLESPNISAEALATQFRTQAVPVIGRTQDERFWLDVRTLYDKEVASIIEAASGIKL